MRNNNQAAITLLSKHVADLELELAKLAAVLTKRSLVRLVARMRREAGGLSDPFLAYLESSVDIAVDIDCSNKQCLGSVMSRWRKRYNLETEINSLKISAQSLRVLSNDNK